MQQGEMLYEGKAKQVFLTDDPDMILIHYKDAATAFNNIKKATIENKGVLNNRISTLIFEYLNKQGIKTHYVKTLNDRDQLCRRVRIIPLEVIVRNVIAGSMAQRLGIEEGTKPSNVIFDICYKNDELVLFPARSRPRSRHRSECTRSRSSYRQCEWRYRCPYYRSGRCSRWHRRKCPACCPPAHQ